MTLLHSAPINTDHGEKELAVYEGDVCSMTEHIDILTSSAFRRSYAPTPRTLFKALDNVGVCVKELAQSPEIDLRRLCDVWLSMPIEADSVNIGRLGCVEFPYMTAYKDEAEQRILNTLKSYFYMLDIAAVHGIPMETVALPLLGSGNQDMSGRMTIVPIINECVAFLRRNHAVKRIWFVEINPGKAQFIARALENSYALIAQRMTVKGDAAGRLAFISYSSKDKNIADNLCAKLEAAGVRVWYAPRDVRGAYAEAITKAIDSATHFVLILSEHSIASEHVLNEIDLAFHKLPDHIRFKPLRIDKALFSPSFKYYLSRQHWMDAIIPPLEARLDEFVTELISEE